MPPDGERMVYRFTMAHLVGEQLTVPTEEEKRSDATFLAAHREMHGFESP